VSPFETHERAAFVAAPAGPSSGPDLDELLATVSTAPPAVVGNERVGAVDVSAMIRGALAAMRAAGDVL
jgi:hypothetical protein